MRGTTTVSAVLLALALLAGCGGGEAVSTDAAHPAPVRRQAPVKSVVPARCPSTAGPGCHTATGRIAYLERVDPDGDGDAHFVIVDFPGISLPGLTAIDVRKGLRPHPLPGIGALVSAAGPVQTGSYGQSQIHALVLHVASR